MSISAGWSFRSTLLCVLLLSLPLRSFAQTKADKEGNVWALKTNAFEWLLTIPNLNFELDLSKSAYNKSTLGVTAKYRWPTYHKYTPSLTFNLLDIRPEYRYYFRTRQKPKDKSKSSGKGLINMLSLRKNPKFWRVQYVGLYADYASYALKFSPDGYQGDGFGLGVSFGYGVPLYQYKKCAIDFELGCSIGMFVTKYDKYAYNSDGCYYYTTGHKDYHPVPFPVVSELRASFAIRPVSISHKYKEDDPEKIEFQKTLEDIKTSFANVNKEIFDGQYGPLELEKYAADKDLYLADFTDYLDGNIKYELDRILTDSTFDSKYQKKLESVILSYRKKIMDDFCAAVGINGKNASGGGRSKVDETEEKVESEGRIVKEKKKAVKKNKKETVAENE